MNVDVSSTARITTRVLQSLEEIRAITPEWRELFKRSPATAFQSPDWLLPWLAVFSPEKIAFVEVRLAGRLIALAPWLIYRRHGELALAFAGGGVSDYLDVLVEPRFEKSALEHILRFAVAINETWTTFDFTDLPAHSPLLALPAFRNSICQHDSCSVLQLPATQEQLPHLFSKRQRANLRNARSRLQRAGGGHIEVATSETVSEFLDDLFRLHTTRWTGRGQAGVLADEKVREFHRRCAPRLLKTGSLHLSRLRTGEHTIAVIYSLFSNQTAYCYLQGFDPEYAHLSPGTQLMYFVICDAIAHGLKQFDFLRGEEAYKQHWRPELTSTYRIQMRRNELAKILQGQNPILARSA